MKRFFTAFLSFVLALSCCFAAYAAPKSEVGAALESSVEFAFDGNYSKNGYNADTSKYLYILALSGADVSAFLQDYFSDVFARLDSGGLTDPGTIGMAAEIARIAGRKDEHARLLAPLENTSAAVSSPYNYYYAAAAAKNAGLDDAARAYAEAMAQYYVPGEGTDFWNGYGTSPDDLAMFILTELAAGERAELVSDAFALLEAYRTDGGYSNYGANADSTALALAAYSAAGSTQKAHDACRLLLSNFYDEETGGFAADYDEYYATADAVFALSLYLPLAEDEPQEETSAEKPGKEEASPSADGSSGGEKSPKTGAPLVWAAAAAAALSSAFIISKRRGVSE